MPLNDFERWRLVMFAGDGASVTDISADTKEEIAKFAEDMGSRWIFYPFAFAKSPDGEFFPLFEDAGDGAFCSKEEVVEWCQHYGAMAF